MREIRKHQVHVCINILFFSKMCNNMGLCVYMLWVNLNSQEGSANDIENNKKCYIYICAN